MMVQSHFAAPFGLSSLAVLDPIVPKGNASFINQYIDRGALPLLLGGNRLRLSIGDYDPMAELASNLRYYSLVSIKFILGQDTEPRIFNSAGAPQAFPLIYEDADTKVKIWENPGAAPRLFLAPQAGVANSWEEALSRLKDTSDLTRQVWLVEGSELTSEWPPEAATGKILSFDIKPNDVHATFEAYTPGILTLTDSYSPGWQAFLNGREAPILLVDGVFRGVRLNEPGIYKLHYHYRPFYWYLSVVLATFGCLLVFGGYLLRAIISPYLPRFFWLLIRFCLAGQKNGKYLGLGIAHV